MKRVAVLLAIVVFSFIAADAAADAPTKPNTFPTMAACKAALESGNFRYYEPKYRGLRSKNPVNGSDRIAVPLESDMCIKMLVVGGRRFVVQKEGTLFRAHKFADGSLVLYARDDCGNPVYDTVFPAPPPPMAVVEPEPEPARIYVPPPPPPSKDDFIPPPIVEKGRKKWPWVVGALAAGAAYAAYYYWPCPDGTKRQ